MPRRRAPGAGNARELKVIALLEEDGWVCASRRHIGGAGDVLAVKPPGETTRRHRVVTALLIEVKSTAGGPYERFGPAARRDLSDLARGHGCEAWLYWWPPRGALARIPEHEWPPIASSLADELQRAERYPDGAE